MDIFYFILILYYLLFLALALKNLKWAVFWVIFILPAYLIRFQIGPLPMTLLEGQILLLFLVWIVKNIKIQEYKNIETDIKRNLLLYCFIALLLLAATISMFISPDIRAAAGLWKAYFIEPILFLIVFISRVKRRDLKDVFRQVC